MRPSDSPRPAVVRPAPRRGRQSIRTAPPGALGEDILLARHGDRIHHFRQDTDGGRTVAVLRDGGTDTAPNHLDGGAVRLSPADRIRLRLAELASAKHAETRRELKVLATAAAIWGLVCLVVFGLMFWGAASMDPQVLESIMSGPMSELGVDHLTGSAEDTGSSATHSAAAGN